MIDNTVELTPEELEIAERYQRQTDIMSRIISLLESSRDLIGWTFDEPTPDEEVPKGIKVQYGTDETFSIEIWRMPE